MAKEDEHQRMLSKQDAGCRFFITQAVYDSGSTRSLLSDYELTSRERGRSPVPVILAGGLTPANVGGAIAAVRPFAVDLCTGLRTEGRLDETKLVEFMRAVATA